RELGRSAEAAAGIDELLLDIFYLFFFQAEDGIRDRTVTGFRRVLFRSNGCRSAGERTSVGPSRQYAGTSRRFQLNVRGGYGTARPSKCRLSQRNGIQCCAEFSGGLKKVQAG